MYRPNHDLDWNEWTLDVSDEYLVFMCPAWWYQCQWWWHTDCDLRHSYNTWEDRPNSNSQQLGKPVAGAG